MKPSGGIIAIGVLSIVVGLIIGLAFTLVLLFLTYDGDILTRIGLDLGFGILFKMLKVPLYIVLAIILIISGIGVFMLKHWARTLALIYAGATLILNIIGLMITVFQGANIWPYSSHYPIAGMIIELIFDVMVYATPIVLLIVFSNRVIKRHFLKTPEEQGNIKMTVEGGYERKPKREEARNTVELPKIHRCSNCGAEYNPKDYSQDVLEWLCSQCRKPLPKK